MSFRTFKWPKVRFAICFLFLPFYLSAQLPSDQFYFVQDESGLQLGDVKEIVTDSNGLIWLGTNTGLYRYDGYHFQLITFSNDSFNRTENAVDALIYDSNGHRLWIGDREGIKRYDILTGKKELLKIKHSDESIKGMNIRDFFLDEDQICWASSYKGLMACPSDTDSCITYSVEKDRAAILNDPYLNRFNSATPHDHPDSIWVAALKGIYSFHKKHGTYSHYLTHFGRQIPGTIVSAFLIYPDFIAIGAYGQGLLLLNKSNKSIQQFKIPAEMLHPVERHPIIAKLKQKDDRSVWVCTEYGLYSFDFVTQTFQHYAKASKLMFEKIYPACRTIVKDKMNHWWVASENGLSQWDPFRNMIKAHHINEIYNDQKTNLIMGIGSSPEEEIMFIGHRKGLNTLTNGEFVPASFHDAIPIDRGESFYNMMILNEDTWLLTDDRALFSYSPKTKTSKKILDRTGHYYSDFHLQLSHYYDADKQRFWMGRQWGRGIGWIDLPTGEYKLYPQATFIQDSLITTSGFGSITADQSGDIWFTTGIGVCRFNPETEHSKNYEIQKRVGIKGYEGAVCITNDSNQNVWFSFIESGIYRYDSKRDSLIPFHYDLSKEIRQFGEILIDHLQFLWAITNQGLLRINLKNGKSIIFNQLNGIPKNNIHGSKLSEVADRYIVINGRNWAGILDQKNILQTNKTLSPPLIESISIRGSSSNMSHTLNEDVRLTRHEHSFDIRYSALNFKAKNLNKYRYQLKGYNEDWIEVGSRNEIQFEQIPAGQYVLAISSASGNSNWSQPATVNIEIIPAWWKTWWALSLAALGLIGGIALFNRYRANQIRREESIKSAYEIKLAELEMEALRSQMNPHFIFNALNSIKHFILSNDKFLAAEYLSNFSRLVRKILNNSKSSVISLEEEIETLKLYLDMEKLRFSSKFEYKIDIDSGVELDEIKIPPLILQPYVENAIWHGLMHKEENGQLLIEIQKLNNNIICIIQDNGIGRKKANEINTKSTLKKKSFGMQITKTRIDMSSIKAKSEINDLMDTSGNPLGTQVVITIPQSKKNITT